MKNNVAPLNVIENIKRASYISDKFKLIYFATPRVANTFWKTAFLKMEGLVLKEEKDISETYMSDSQKQEHLVGNRKLNPLRAVTDLKELIELQKKGYKTFAVVRDPIERVFSAWSCKILCHDLKYIKERYLDLPNFPTPKYETPEEVKESFEDWVVYLKEHEASLPNFSDRHWNSQYKWLAPDKIKYDILLDISDSLEQYKIFLQSKNLSYEDPNYKIPRLNESVIKYNSYFISETSEKIIKELYKEDYFFKVKQPKDNIFYSPWPSIILKEIIMKNERMDVFNSYIQKLRGQK